MAFPPHIKNEIHRAKEAAEAALPYDPTVATKAIVPPPPSEYQKTVVWDKNPWDRFDRKTVLAYTGNQDRIAKLLPEFARVGLNDVNIHWNFDNPFIEIVKSNHTFRKEYSKSIVNNTIRHYSIIKTAFSLGCESCLLMEDDIRFLRDLDQMKKILDSMPEDYDIVMLDSIAANLNEGVQVSECWRTFNNMWSAACYGLSRSGMEYMINAYEMSFKKNTILPFRSSDEYFQRDIMKMIGNNLNCYYSLPCVARQTSIQGSKTNTNYVGWSQQYDGRGCSRSKYGK